MKLISKKSFNLFPILMHNIMVKQSQKRNEIKVISYKNSIKQIETRRHHFFGKPISKI